MKKIFAINKKKWNHLQYVFGAYYGDCKWTLVIHRRGFIIGLRKLFIHFWYYPYWMHSRVLWEWWRECYESEYTIK